MTDTQDAQKARAAAWFRELRDRIVAAFEGLEDRYGSGTPGRFEVTPTNRADGGGGLMSVMRGGRVFEKVGVNVSEVHGTLGERAQKALAARGVPGMDKDPRFWASGISLVAHMRSPLVPAVHMNTRHIATTKTWFGGGADLNPTTAPVAEDTAHFHAVLKAACDRHDPAYHPRFSKWCDEYFFIPHRGEPRGVGGIFYDTLDTGSWESDFAFTRDVGTAFLDAYLPIVRRRMELPWTEADRATQLARRGRYAEFNLVYDRGTKFGLMTGGNPEAILMSLPPVATWP